MLVDIDLDLGTIGLGHGIDRVGVSSGHRKRTAVHAANTSTARRGFHVRGKYTPVSQSARISSSCKSTVRIGRGESVDKTEAVVVQLCLYKAAAAV